jgi:melanoma-associated antigen
MLFKTHQNSGCPIKREELTQLITKNYHQRNLPTFVINEAKDKLAAVFGYEMRELSRSVPSSKSQTRASQSEFFVSPFYARNEQSEFLTLLISVLSMFY